MAKLTSNGAVNAQGGSKLPEHVVILGAGPAGLATGHELSRSGVRVTVVEKNDFVGGLCRTLEADGFKFDLGGHRWFTKNEDLNNWFRRLMEGEIVMVNRISRIYHSKIFYDYPISMGNVIKQSSLMTILHAGTSYVWEKVRRFFHNPPVTNMKEAYTAQFGSKLYKMFFEQYSEKVWGAPCDELSADWVTQRSKGLSIVGVVKDALFKSKEQKYISLIEEFMYPRDGYMRIPERMTEDIEATGNRVLLSSKVVKVLSHGPNDLEVFYETPDGETHSERCDRVVSTIPLGLLAHLSEPKCSPEVETAARGMVFRDLITVNMKMKRKQVTPDTWIYVQDKSILFGRIHEPKNWSKAMVPDDEHTSLVLEIFCTDGDEIWKMTDEEITERCTSDLVDTLEFVDRSEVIGADIVRTRQAYPVYDMEYQSKIDTVMEFINSMPGVNVVGRGGSFRYNNADHSIEMGLILGQRLMGANIDHMAVNTEPEYQEIISSPEITRDRFAVKPTDTDAQVPAE